MNRPHVYCAPRKQPVSTTYELSDAGREYIPNPALGCLMDIHAPTGSSCRLRSALLLILALLLALCGCSSMPTSYVDQIKKPPVREFYATDRNYLGLPGVTGMYGDGRDSVSYGTVQVSVPQRHFIGSIQNKSNARDSSRHFIVLNQSLLGKEAFFATLADATRKKDILLYVHGFNTSFEHALQSMAQISSDLDFNGCSVVYSWPSTNKISGYLADEGNALWSQHNLKKFLNDVATKSNAENIYLLAHSLGNRELTGAFIELIKENPSLKNRFKALIMAAADVDTMIFLRDIAPALISTESMITLYVSRNDKALMLSDKLHEHSRVGESGYLPVIVPGIETVDATDVDDSYLGHSYYSTSRAVLSDIYYIIKKHLKADFRFSLQAIDTKEGGRFWKFCK